MRESGNSRTKARLLSAIMGFLCFFIVLGMHSYVSAGLKSSLGRGRVLHFPKDKSIGDVLIQDENAIREITTFHYHTRQEQDWKYLAQAKGDVFIPAGKRVKLWMNQENCEDLSGLSRLKADDLYELRISTYQMDIRWSGNNAMRYISNLSGLNVLNIGGVEFSDESVRHLLKLTSLQRLSLRDNLTRKGFVAICRLNNLKGLYITSFDDNVQINNSSLRNLSNLTELEELALNNCPIGNSGLQHLGKLGKLRYLALSGERYSDEGIKHLVNIDSLKILYMGHLTQLTNKAVEYISEHQGLNRISFHWNENINDDCVEHLKKMKSLTHLDLYHAGLTDDGIGEIAKIKSLEYVFLPSMGISDESLKHVSQLTQLKTLWIGTASLSTFSDAGVQYLPSLKNLNELVISGNGITDKGLAAICSLEKLKKLSLGQSQITNEGLKEFNKLKNIEHLSFRSDKVTFSGLYNINSLKKINYLEAHKIRQDNKGLDLADLPSLEKLTIIPNRRREKGEIVHDNWRDEDIECLSKLKNLKWLQGVTGISDKGMAYLAGFEKMERLSIRGEKITDMGLGYVSNLSNLKQLYIRGSFTDKGFEHLKSLKLLSTLNIASYTDFSPSALKDLEKSLPYIMEINNNSGQIRKLKPRIESGQTALDFKLTTFEGKALSLGDFKDKYLLLYFWATWSKPCVANGPMLQKFYDYMKKQHHDFEILGISHDNDEEAARKYVREKSLSWPQACVGLYSRIAADYGIDDKAPVFILIGKDGKILSSKNKNLKTIESIISKQKW